MKINNPNIYITSKEIKLSECSPPYQDLWKTTASGCSSDLTASCSLEKEDWEQLSQESMPRNTTMLFRGKKGPQRPSLPLVKQSLAGQKDLMFL